MVSIHHYNPFPHPLALATAKQTGMKFFTYCVLSAVLVGPACLSHAQAQSVELTTPQLRVGSAFSNITSDRLLPNYNGSPLQPGDGSQFLLAHVVYCTDGETETPSFQSM